jgi:aryl-alcohol dehydrogenase-like predicted oxidoreductase
VLDDEQRDYAEAEGIEVWAYTPLLGGAYDNPDKEIPEVFDHPGSTRRLAELDKAAAELGAARGQVVPAWLRAHGTRPMLGGSTLGQLDSALAGVRLDLPDELLARLDAAG